MKILLVLAGCNDQWELTPAHAPYTILKVSLENVHEDSDLSYGHFIKDYVIGHVILQDNNGVISPLSGIEFANVQAGDVLGGKK